MGDRSLSNIFRDSDPGDGFLENMDWEHFRIRQSHIPSPVEVAAPEEFRSEAAPQTTAPEVCFFPICAGHTMNSLS